MGRSRGGGEKHIFWQEHFRLWKESGLSQVEYCRKNGLGKHSFHYWRSRLRVPDVAGGLVEITGMKVFQEIQTAPAMRLLLGRGYSVEIERGFCAETLDRLLGVLEGR